MTLTSGERLGPYEIESPVGAGGMGEVYRARDTRLDRLVAIKLLPASFADHPERRQRFHIEARAISALQHPHICTLFDIGEEDGQVFLVLEYLEGETLQDRLTHGALPANDVLRYASQIASAIDHAHRTRIVHRDLKPSNVMLIESGVKLLDFGLARAPALASAAASTVSFRQDKLTGEGTIIGTFQYMAPEQLEGRVADERTDIFAFGALLYEMATGRPAFEATSQASLIAAILTGQPLCVSSTRAERRSDGLPAALDHVVERCLAKNPDERWQTARDLKAALGWIGEGKFPSTDTPITGGRRRGKVIAWAAAIIVLLAAIGAILFRWRDEPSQVTRFAVTLPSGSAMTRVRGDATFLAVSPDGRHVAFVANSEGQDDLWVQSLDSATPRVLVSGQRVMSLFWSPDSRFVGFFAAGEGALKKVEISGGPARTIHETRNSGVPLWLDDGTILFGEFRQGLFRVSAEGGKPTQVTRIDPTMREINHFWPSVLPDGRHFLYMTTRLDESGRRATPIVYVASLDSSEPRKEIARVNSGMVYTQSGRVLYVHEGALLAQTFDLAGLRLTGEPVRLAEGLDYNRSTGASAFSVSDAGTLVYKSAIDPVELVWFDRSGKEIGTLGMPLRAGNIRISPDGDRVAVEVTDPRRGNSDIWVYDLARGVGAPVTTDVNDERLPTWAPDGRRIAFVSDRGTGSDASGDFFVKRSDGMGEEDAFLVRVGPQFLEDWSRDGRSIAYRDETRDTGDNVWILPLNGAQTPVPFLRTRFEEWGARFSPDSRWVAFVSNESGMNEVYVAPVEGRGPRIQVSVGGGISPRWRSNGEELFFLSRDGTVVMAAQIALTPVLKPGVPRSLFTMPRETDLQARLLNTVYDVAPDGQRFLFSVAVRKALPGQIAVVLNWPALLQQ